MLQKNSGKNILIIGCSPFGAAIATDACKLDFYVTVVDSDESSFERLPAFFNGFTVIGDGMEAANLKSAGILSADVVVATTEDDDANMMITQIAMTHFKRKAFAVISDPNKKGFCDALAIPCICPTLLAVRQAEDVVMGIGEGQ